MFTKNNTFDQIMHTEPIQKAIGNLFPSCWTQQILPRYAAHTMQQIESEVQMEWGVPFFSDAFVESANILMDTVQNERFVFIPLWQEPEISAASDSLAPWIPDSDQNDTRHVWLFTGNPQKDLTAFAHTSGSGSVPPYPSHAVPDGKYDKTSVRPAVIICPGGGYEMLSTYSEGIQLAQRMERDGGYKAFVLNYRIAPHSYPLPQTDLALAIMHVRIHAAQYRIDPNRILIIGSSAGGHLCASEAALHETLKQEALSRLRQGAASSDILKTYESVSARPDGIGLLYPVVSFLSEYHEGSYLNLTNDKPGLREALSVEKHITSDYPATYAFANKDDDCVPASNTTRLEQALAKAGVAHLCEIYPTGGHGVGLGYDCSCSMWSERMLEFFEQVF
ncbi:MAG: alpha/beta hydrolase [Eubacterium sp.]|nr:alpha/beta hydrolase [Eubacterium sp.]